MMPTRARTSPRRSSSPVLAAISCVALAFLPSCGDEASSTDIALDACAVDGAPARCATVMVPEDRSDAHGGEIPVRVVVFPATGATREPDPVVWFAGGPGDSAVDTVARVRPLLATENTDRDLVLIEQRGTGA
jgi:pimeloyl-ACP methyl ester carboxylesterase